MYSNHKIKYLKSIYLIYKNGLTFLFIFSVIDLISSHIFLLNNLAEGLSSLLADVIITYSVIKLGEIKGDKVLELLFTSRSHNTAGKIAHQSLGQPSLRSQSFHPFLMFFPA